ncbi:MAG: HAD family phosphatase [Actinomycetota bacterium]|nr:HAD family phosphatase [Actinomycetota bacterium]
MAWLVCDYGGVLSRDQPDADRAALVQRSGLEEAEFWRAYWRHRPAYDRADLSGPEYWTRVVGVPPPSSQLTALVRIDVASWSHPNEDVVAAAHRAGTRGFHLALLSNAPVEVARGIERLPWLAAFQPRFFSCDLGAIKPEPAIYRSVIDALGGNPAELVFFDDRDDNVVAAAELGVQAHRFTAPSQFDRL